MKHDPPPPALQPALNRLKADLAVQHAPAMVWPVVQPATQSATQPALVAEGPAPGGSSGGSGLGPAGRAMVVIGAAVLTALALAWLLRPLPAAPPPAGPGELIEDADGSGFLPVAPPERFAELWQGGALAAPAWVVRTELPRERLAALGLPYDPARAGETVRAELLMHPAGDVLAVRLTR